MLHARMSQRSVTEVCHRRISMQDVAARCYNRMSQQDITSRQPVTVISRSKLPRQDTKPRCHRRTSLQDVNAGCYCRMSLQDVTKGVSLQDVTTRCSFFNTTEIIYPPVFPPRFMPPLALAFSKYLIIHRSDCHLSRLYFSNIGGF